MGRRLRIEFAGAIDHAMSRGNARQKIVREARDDGRFMEGLEATIDKFQRLFGMCLIRVGHMSSANGETRSLSPSVCGWVATRGVHNELIVRQLFVGCRICILGWHPSRIDRAMREIDERDG